MRFLSISKTNSSKLAPREIIQFLAFFLLFFFLFFPAGFVASHYDSVKGFRFCAPLNGTKFLKTDIGRIRPVTGPQHERRLRQAKIRVAVL
jgi:hypothetical protein